MLQVIARLFDPTALALVAVGSFGTAALRSTGRDLSAALRALRPMISASPARDADAARTAVRRIERLVTAKGIACADQVECDCALVRKASIRLVDAASAQAFAAWAEDELATRQARRQTAAAVWRAAADASPNVGMVGTVLGLIGMFASLDDPAAMAPAMALAMLTTFYGLVFGTFIFGPIAARLERLAAASAEWERTALARLQRLAEGEAQTTRYWPARRSRPVG